MTGHWGCIFKWAVCTLAFEKFNVWTQSLTRLHIYCIYQNRNKNICVLVNMGINNVWVYLVKYTQRSTVPLQKFKLKIQGPCWGQLLIVLLCELSSVWVVYRPAMICIPLQLSWYILYMYTLHNNIATRVLLVGSEVCTADKPSWKHACVCCVCHLEYPVHVYKC